MSIMSPREEGPVADVARPGQTRLDVLPGKLPEPRPGCVKRTALVNRLRASRAPVVTIVAPAGYGKTTVLAQWMERDARPWAWVTIDERDDDPILLLHAVAAAL